MSCNSELYGTVRMSWEAYIEFSNSTVVCNDEELPIGEYLDNLDYEEPQVIVYRNGFPGDADDQVVALLAKYKDYEGLDTVDWQSEVPGKGGRYYVDRGRWCYVRTIIPPPPPPDSTEWQQVDANS